MAERRGRVLGAALHFRCIRSMTYRSRIVGLGAGSKGLTQYSDVPPSVHRALMVASSHGSYLNRYVKGRFRYRQVS
jgi:hypothetical protein